VTGKDEHLRSIPSTASVLESSENDDVHESYVIIFTDAQQPASSDGVARFGEWKRGGGSLISVGNRLQSVQFCKIRQKESPDLLLSLPVSGPPSFWTSLILTDFRIKG